MTTLMTLVSLMTLMTLMTLVSEASHKQNHGGSHKAALNEKPTDSLQ